MSNKSLSDFFSRYQNTPGSDALYFMAAKSNELPGIPSDVVGRQNVFDYLLKWSIGDRSSIIKETPNAVHQETTNNINTQVIKELDMVVSEGPTTVVRPNADVDENKDPSQLKENLDILEKDDILEKEDLLEKEENGILSSPISVRLRKNLRSLNIED